MLCRSPWGSYVVIKIWNLIKKIKKNLRKHEEKKLVQFNHPLLIH